MRSSREWDASTTTRPSGLRRCTDSSRPDSRLGSSRLTSMRMAWNVRRAGGPPRRLGGAGRRVAPAPAGGGGDAALHGFDELTGAAERTGGDDLGRDPAGVALLA